METDGAPGDTFSKGNFSYKVNADGVSVTVTGLSDDVTDVAAPSIPSQVSDGTLSYTVTAIGDKAFYDCTELSGKLKIGKNVKTIGPDAFPVTVLLWGI